jgi:hypothetical protein
MLSLAPAESSRSTSVTGVRLARLGRQLVQATAEVQNLLLAGAIVRLALFGRQEAKTLPAQAIVGLLNSLSAGTVGHLALIGRQQA